MPRARTGIRLRNALHVGDAPRCARAASTTWSSTAMTRTEMRVPFDAERVDVGAWIDAYRETYGAPVFEDEAITVFAVRPG